MHYFLSRKIRIDGKLPYVTITPIMRRLYNAKKRYSRGTTFEQRFCMMGKVFLSSKI